MEIEIVHFVEHDDFSLLNDANIADMYEQLNLFAIINMSTSRRSSKTETITRLLLNIYVKQQLLEEIV